MKNRISIIILGLILCCNACSDSDCVAKYAIKDVSIRHINDIARINEMILRNIQLLEDSCCQNCGQCETPDSIRRNYFFPATKYLLNKYLPETERETLELIDKLSPRKYYTNQDPLIMDLRFRPDSTIKYPIFKETCGDSIIEHHIIFQPGTERGGNFFNGNGPSVIKYSDNGQQIKEIKRMHIKPNWTYYIVQYKYVIR